MKQYYPEIALHVPTILLPRDGVPYHRFAVVACDQYTWEPEYWEQVEQIVGDSPSALRLVLPEVYLEAEDREARIAGIRRTMQEYLDQGILQPREPGFVVVDRQTALAPSRHGLVVALDLEHCDYREGATSLIRATEGTLVDRLPSRVEIRQGAPIELPHIMVLIDDPDGTVIEPLLQEDLPLLYDFDLMQGAGHIRGWHVTEPRLVEQVAARLGRLAAPEVVEQRYGAGHTPLLYATGDGNHSLAAAKEAWERLKAEAQDPVQVAGHPARYALVELVNVHDEGLGFEPIHRAVFDVDTRDLLTAMEAYYRKRQIGFERRMFASQAEWERGSQVFHDARHCILFVAAGEFGVVWIDDSRHHLGLASLQAFLDSYMAAEPTVRLDYIHGDDTLLELASSSRAAGFLFPAVDKHDLFPTIVLDGAFPRKTFSMGEPDEKRFYIEARRILP